MGTTGSVIGGALSEAANSYLEAVLDRPYERIRRRKAELELEELEARTKERAANAARLERQPAGPRGMPPAIKTRWGDVYTWNQETQQYEKFLEAPAPPEKQLTPEQSFQQTVLGTIEKKLGKPRDQWTSDDLLRDDIRQLVDLLYKQTDIVAVPGAIPTTRDVIRGRVRGRQQPGSTPAQEGGAGAPPTRQAPPTRSTPPASQAPPSGTTSGRDIRAILPWVAGYVVQYDRHDDSALQSALDRLSAAQAENPSPVLEAQLMAIGRIMARRSRTGQPGGGQAPPGRRSSLTPDVEVVPQFVSTYADAMRSITPRGALQMVSALRQADPASPFARAAVQAYNQVYPQPVDSEPLDVLALAQQPGWAETAVQPQDLARPQTSPAFQLTRVAARPEGGGDIEFIQPRPTTPDAVRRLTKELFGERAEPDKLTQDQQKQLNRELARREAQAKQRYEDELNNTRALQDVRPQDFDRFFYRKTGEPVSGTMPYGVVKSLQSDPDVETGVVHLTTDNAKTLSVLKMLEPTLAQYSELIQYAYGPGGPLAGYERTTGPILNAMMQQFAQTDPGLQARRRIIEGQLQSLVRALGSRGDLNAQELEQATGMIANMDASLGFGFTTGIGLGRGGVGPMVGFRPTISIPDTPQVGLELANRLITQVNKRIGTLTQNPAYEGTLPVELPKERTDLKSLQQMTPEELRSVPESALAPVRSLRDLVGAGFTEEQQRVLAVRLRERLRSQAESRGLPTGRPRTPGIPPALEPLWP